MTVGGASSEVVMLGNQIHSSIVLKKESETLHHFNWYEQS